MGRLVFIRKFMCAHCGKSFRLGRDDLLHCIFCDSIDIREVRLKWYDQKEGMIGDKNG